MIHVLADIVVKPGHRDEFVALFQQLVPTVLAEEGCLAYAPTVELDTGIGIQLPLRPHVVTVIEQWESVEALRKHLDAARMNEFREKVAHMVDGLTIRVTQPA